MDSPPVEHERQTIPPGIIRIELPQPCAYCQSTHGYDDTRYDRKFCAKCGRAVRRRG